MPEEEEELESLRAEVGKLREEIARLTPPLEILLKTRGFRVLQRRPPEPPLLPGAPFLERYYELLGSYSFRLFLRDVIKCADGFSVAEVTRFATRQVTELYVRYLIEMKMAEPAGTVFRLKENPRSFGPTLEWYVAEVFRREYRTEALWGIRFKRPKVGGDYDVIAKLGGRIVYTEVKSSPPKQVYQSEITEFFRRVDDLSPEISVFLMDTELRMKDKIVPMFEEELARRRLDQKVVRMQRELFQTGNRIFIINAKGGIPVNIGKLIRWYFIHK